MTRKILYIVHDGQLYGSQQSLLLILSGLSRLKFRPLISLARSGPLEDLLKQFQFDLPILHHKRLMWFKHDVRNVFQQIGDVLALILAAPFRVWKLVGLIKKHQIDLVHTNSVVSLEGALAAKLAGVSHVWHIRELFMADSPKLRSVLPKSWTRKLIMALSDRVICISQAVADQFDHATVIYNAINVRDWDFKIKPRSGDLKIGYVGRLTEGKRFHDLLSALPANATLKVAGTFVDAPYEKRVQDLVSEQHLQDRIEWLGYQTDLKAFFASIDILVLTSLNEPFGRVLIEAMASGVPCVAANSGGVPEIITDGLTGLLYPPGSPEMLSTCLNRLSDDSALAIKIAENAGRMVQDRFTITVQQQQLADCYQQVLEPLEHANHNQLAHAEST